MHDEYFDIYLNHIPANLIEPYAIKFITIRTMINPHGEGGREGEISFCFIMQFLLFSIFLCEGPVIFPWSRLGGGILYILQGFGAGFM